MITAIVQFKLPHPITAQEARDVFASTAPRYRDLPGLLRKSYLLSEDGGTAGGAYTWRSLEDAKGFYTDEWRSFVIDKYGCEPWVTYYATPVLVDNVQKEIVIES